MNCPLCGATGAYQALIDVECTNTECDNWTMRQQDAGRPAAPRSDMTWAELNEALENLQLSFPNWTPLEIARINSLKYTP